MQGGDGSLVLVDLAAAFPSLSQEYMFKVLERQGIPVGLCNAIKQLYINNLQHIKVDGETSPSFLVKSGVRQGCPLSPVLFALALDPFLAYLKRCLPSETLIRAYADDMAIILKSRSLIPIVAKAFQVLSSAASMHVHVGKTVYVPLYATTLFQARKDISDTGWSGMAVAIGFGKYLGYIVGPHATAEMNFEAPMEKVRARSAYWLSMRHLGSFFQVLGFNMCALSVLAFTCQLYMLPSAYVEEATEVALKFMLGPGEWFMGRGSYRGHPFFRARLDLNMQASPRCPHASSIALHYNTCLRFMPDYMTKYHTLYALLGILRYRDGMKVLADSPISSCQAVHDMMRQPCVQREIQKNVSSAGVAAATYQAAFNHLHPIGSVQQQFDARYRERWCKKKLVSSPKVALMASTAIENLKWLSKHVPPRVHMSNVRLHLNAWHTGSRYQQKHGNCLFCRSSMAEDRIEHIFFCPVVQDVLPHRLRSGTPPLVSVDTWLLMRMVKQDRLLMALYVHAIYCMHNLYRHTPDRGEFQKCVQRCVLDIPLKGNLRKFVHDVVSDSSYN